MFQSFRFKGQVIFENSTLINSWSLKSVFLFYIDICFLVCYCRQPKIKSILLKIYVVVRVRIVPTENIQPSFMLREQGRGGLSIMKTILRKTVKEQFKLKYQNQSREQTLVQVNIHHQNFTTDHRRKYISIHTLNIHRWNYFPISPQSQLIRKQAI